ncbi:MAG TPA: hypothetical protein DCQ64_20260 [Candidatus Rokubacteria bacterium]|nr:hypothetical protein [Candidatus Rokubacteria bacterium]
MQRAARRAHSGAHVAALRRVELGMELSAAVASVAWLCYGAKGTLCRMLLLQLLVTVWFNGLAVPCVVDTGAAFTAVRRSVYDAIPQQPVAPRARPFPRYLFPVTVMTANGALVHGVVEPVHEVRTEYLTWHDAEVLVVADEQAAFSCLLGANLLRQQPLVLDWEAQTVMPLERLLARPEDEIPVEDGLGPGRMGNASPAVDQ